MSLKVSSLSKQLLLNAQVKQHAYPIHDKIGVFEDILNKGLILRVKVTGKSMTPFLKGGEVLTIKKASPSSLKKGDLIFFRNLDGFLVLHRLIKKMRVQNNMFIFQTKGDSIIYSDEAVHENDVLGKVRLIEKTISYGKTKSIDMESSLWRTMNFIIALVSVIKSKTYSAAHKIYRIK